MWNWRGVKFQLSWRNKVLQLDNQSRNELPGEVVSTPSLREIQVECRHEFMEIQEP